MRIVLFNSMLYLQECAAQRCDYNVDQFEKNQLLSYDVP